MLQTEMLAPAAVLVLWSLVVLLWMVVTRFSQFGKLGTNLASGDSTGKRGTDLNGVLPDRTMWKAHNYDHLMEQPTIFYPTVIVLALVGATAMDVWLAWAYVGLRVVHSFWQALVNKIPVRIVLFALSSLCLIALAIRAVTATLLAGAA